MGLEPAKEDEDGVIPYNKSGRNCPLLDKPCRDVCHTCEFWQPLDLVVNGQVKTQWRCAYIWQATLAGRMSVQLQALEIEVHRQSDEMRNFRAAQIQLLEGLTNANMLLARGAVKQLGLAGARQNELVDQREGTGATPAKRNAASSP